MPEPYDLRSNIKGKAGSQGTLFQVTDKSLLNTEKRYPRGYTPERQQAVDEVLPKVVGQQRAPKGSFNDKKGEWDFHYPADRAVVRDAVARSSIPVSDLQGLTRVSNGVPKGRLGQYTPRTKRMDLDFHQPRNTMDQVIVHEIGHHVDNKAGNSDSFTSVYGPSKVDVGRGEAVADNYLEDHYNPHPRHAKEPLDDYAHRFGHDEMQERYPGYTEHRKSSTPLSGPQFDQPGLF